MRYILFSLTGLFLANCGANQEPRADNLGHNLMSNKIGLVYEGNHYYLNQDFSHDGKMVFGKSNDLSETLVLAADGQYVSAVVVANDNGVMAGGISGDSSSSSSPKVQTYNGEYRLVSSENPYMNNQTQEVRLKLNFDLGTVSGKSINDPKGEYISQFRGIIHSKDIEMYFIDETGVHQGEGNVFGPSGDEFAAYYVSDTHGGMIYAQKD